MLFFPMDWPDWGETESWIKINGVPLPLGAGRNVDQTYDAEEFGVNERALDGGLIFMGIADQGFRLNTTINGDGNFAPHLMMFRPWQSIELECATPIYMPGQVSAQDLLRMHVPGSIRYFENATRGDQSYLRAVGGEGLDPNPNITWTGFRPKLLVRPQTFSYGMRENSKLKNWSWTLREDQDLRDL